MALLPGTFSLLTVLSYTCDVRIEGMVGKVNYAWVQLVSDTRPSHSPLCHTASDKKLGRGLGTRLDTYM